MLLDKSDILFLEQAVAYAREALIIVGNNDEKADFLHLDRLSQHAVMYCFKKIGEYIKKAGEHETTAHEKLIFNEGLKPYQQKPNDTIVFWKRLHHLRHRLVNDFYFYMVRDFQLSDQGYEHFCKICSTFYQVVDYLNAIIKQTNTHEIYTAVGLFEVFDIHIQNFIQLLINNRACKQRRSISQKQYAQALIQAINIIEIEIFANSEIITENLIDNLDLRKKYALYNFLDCIDTLISIGVNKKRDDQLITESSRQKIFEVNHDFYRWFWDLHKSRNKGIHDLREEEPSSRSISLIIHHLRYLKPILNQKFLNTLDDQVKQVNMDNKIEIKHDI